ncbi:MAG: GAF domain-containing protein [Planctomycetes bacterium]|nr:GAF domain-containing protein [Planctomycetota bacterium]
MTDVRLDQLSPCFQGVIPALIATCDRDGEPNVTYLSQVYLVDAKHVALSFQFFNKTKLNIEQNPYATVILLHPLNLESWRMKLRFEHSETSGELFDTMAARIEVIASHTGMAGVFKLLSADVYEVLSLERMDGWLVPPDPVLDAEPPKVPAGPLTELRGLQTISQRVARAKDLDELLSGALTALDELFSFSNSMVLVPDDSRTRLVTIASRGYGSTGIGAEVAVGAGIVGLVAQRRKMIRVAGFGSELRYGRAIRSRVEEVGERGSLSAEIPLPGLCDAQAQLALPMLVGDELVGVLAVESRDPLCFDEWDESFLQIVANQIALGIERMESGDDEVASEPACECVEIPAAPALAPRRFVFYRNDDCVFVDGEYLVRNVPGKILWKLLKQHHAGGPREFTNRELRLDPTLGLPPVKDNLESRLILLRKRLAEKCPDVRLVPVRRGRFALEVASPVELVEKDSA